MSEVLKAGRLDDKRDRPPCQHCGGAIPAAAPAHRIFCSRHCQRRGIYHRNKAARQRACVVCDAPYLASIENQITCGWSCSGKLRDPVARACLWCEAAIDRPRRDQLYCGKSCVQKASRARCKARNRG